MTDAELLLAWEQAYLSMYKYGHIGRVFKGTVHNLNGVVQAFSMQTELFELMFSKFRKQLTPLYDEPLSSAAIASINTVLKLCEKREKMLVPMVEKIAYSQEIIKNTENVCHRDLDAESLSLQILMQNVVNFYQSDMYFKHKVNVTFDLPSNVVVDSVCNELGLVFQNIIQNSITSLVLSDTDQPRIVITSSEDNQVVQVHISDNGAGVDSAVAEDLFKPFVSAWDEQSGLGLYFCKRICDSIGYSLHYVADGESTDFIVTIPK